MVNPEFRRTNSRRWLLHQVTTWIAYEEFWPGSTVIVFEKKMAGERVMKNQPATSWSKLFKHLLAPHVPMHDRSGSSWSNDNDGGKITPMRLVRPEVVGLVEHFVSLDAFVKPPINKPKVSQTCYGGVVNWKIWWNKKKIGEKTNGERWFWNHIKSAASTVMSPRFDYTFIRIYIDKEKI